MANYTRCDICGEYGYMRIHQCKPVFQVIRRDYDDIENPRTERGYDEEEAAKKYAEKNFSEWDYLCDTEIWVRKSENDEWVKFSVTVQDVPEFFAERL